MIQQLRRVRGKLAGSPFVAAVAMVAGGTALSQGLVVLTSPVLTRVYSPEEMGVFAIYTSALAILAAVVCLRYEQAVALAATAEGSANLVALSTAVALVVSGLAGLGLYLERGAVAAYLGPGAGRLLWLFPLSLSAAGFAQAAAGWATRQRAFASMTRARLAETGLQVCLQIGLGFAGGGVMGLVAGRVLGQGAGASVLAASRSEAGERPLRSVSLRGMWEAAVRFRRFPLLAAGAGLLNSAGTQIAQLLLGLFYGAQVAGWFALGQRMVGVPMLLVGQAVAQVYAAEVARLARENPAAIRRLFQQSAVRLLLIGAPPILLLGAVGPRLFSLLFGPDWREAGTYTQVLVFMMLAQFVVVPLSYTLDALERQDLQLIWDAGRLLLVLGALLAAHWLAVGPGAAVALYGTAMTVGYVALYGVVLLAIRRPGGGQAPGLESDPG